MSRKRGPVETIEYGKMVARMMRSWAARVTHADEPELAQMIAAANDLEVSIARAIYGQRTIYGRSWADIARATGTTRSGAQDRWGPYCAIFEKETLAAGALQQGTGTAALFTPSQHAAHERLMGAAR